MSKELEALENLVNREIISKYKDRNIDFYWNDESSQDYKIIENALKENESLKSQVVGLENAYDKLADKCEKYYKALEQYHKIEEELGIDLITLFKALKNGVYYKGEYYPRCSINSMNWGILFIHYDYEEDYVHIVNIEDYGKTWSLNKEDLQ